MILLETAGEMKEKIYILLKQRSETCFIIRDESGSISAV